MKSLNQRCVTLCLAALASIASVVSFSTLAAEEVRAYPLTKVAPHTYVIHGPLGYPSVENQGFMNNPGFVITDSGVVVIDPGSSLQAGRMLLKQMRTITRLPVTHVFNTHVHGDHWLGNHAIIEAYPKAKIYGHPEMIKKITDGEGEQWVSLMDKSTNGFTRGTRAVPPSVQARDNTEHKIGGITFRIYAPEKAHSHTDIMIEAVEDSVIFTGDNVLNQTIGRLVDGTFAGNIAACDKIAAVKARRYVPGHGQTGDVSVVSNYRNYLATLYEVVKQQYDLGKSDFEMKSTVVSRLDTFKNWLRFDLEVGPQISQAVLEVEAAM